LKGTIGWCEDQRKQPAKRRLEEKPALGIPFRRLLEAANYNPTFTLPPYLLDSTRFLGFFYSFWSNFNPKAQTDDPNLSSPAYPTYNTCIFGTSPDVPEFRGDSNINGTQFGPAAGGDLGNLPTAYAVFAVPPRVTCHFRRY
jgi:hypothetical protein